MSDKINASINETNSNIIEGKILDPYLLAKRIWQKIWINTGKEPEKCLYNVVELFTFKFLSDLGVLRIDLNQDFNHIYHLSKKSQESALTYYAEILREKIRKLFPSGKDGTTIINGTIFVTENGEPNLSQARLFSELLQDFIDYEKEFGTFKNIDKNFKTKLYESFLKQSSGIKRLGQFFTPRKVVQAMVKMSSINQLKVGSRVCDPFCGVGGFILESINLNDPIRNSFKPKHGKAHPIVNFKGFDQGTSEKDDERTIILAKANMLIYFSQLIEEFHSTEDIKFFSNIFNNTFELIRDNLGTLSLSKADVGGGFDLILSNPPYVAKGARSIKNEIIKRGLSDSFSYNGTGIEGQCVEWIVRSLNKRGQALVILPDSVLRRSSDSYLREKILENCYLDAIVSLPVRTFFATPKKTYILVLTKKEEKHYKQKNPVFAFIVREIGESRDVNRIETPEKNDLNIMVNLFNQFKGNPQLFKPESVLCKKIEIDTLTKGRKWIIENYWNREEKELLGISDEIQTISIEDFKEAINDMMSELNVLQNNLSKSFRKVGFKEIQLGDPSYFEPLTSLLGYTQKQYIPMNINSKNGIPIFTAQKEPVVFIRSLGTKSPYKATPNNPNISIASDGDGTAGTNIVYHVTDYYLNTSRISYRILNSQIFPKYIFYALQGIKEEYGFNYGFKATLTNQAGVSIAIPVNSEGCFDLEMQKNIANTIEQIEKNKTRIQELTKNIINNKIKYFSYD